MAGQAGYYMVQLDDRSAGVVRVPANQHPTSVGGHKVVNLSYLGTTEQDILANFANAAGRVGAPALFELGPPNSASGPDQGTLIHLAVTRGSGILTHAPSSAEWDPTFTILAAGLGGIVSGAVQAAAATGASDAATAAETNAATGAASGGVASGAAAAAGKVASKAAGAIASKAGAVATAVGLGALFGNIELWKGVGLVLAGVLILLIAGRELVKL